MIAEEQIQKEAEESANRWWPFLDPEKVESPTMKEQYRAINENRDHLKHFYIWGYKEAYIAGATKEAERCKPLIKALYSAKETLGLAVLLDKSDTMQNEINEIEKVLQDYNKK